MTENSTSSRFQFLFDAALWDYEEQTGTKLVLHPLATKLEACDSVESITAVFQEQALAFRESRGDDGKLMKSLEGVLHALHKLSSSTALRTSIGHSFPPAKAILTGFGILLVAVKNVSASFDAVIVLLEDMGKFLNRLEVYTNIPPTPAMTEIVVEILVELISTLSLATKEMKQGRPKKFVKELLGKNKVEGALQRLDKLAQNESRTIAAQTLEAVYGLIDDTNTAKREQLQKAVENWLSPPDPWKNHSTLYESHHSETGTWFLQGDTYTEWKLSSPSSLLWIHGKPGAGKSVFCSTIIEDIDGMRKARRASLAFFYCDFRDDKKKDLRGLLSSLLVQLCDQSDSYYDILSDFYSEHRRGSQYPGNDALLRCLIRMLKLSGNAPAFIIVDALDECPNTTGAPSPREKVLNLVEELVNSQIPNLHICVTSRPEADIQLVLDRLAFRSVSLHGEGGQIDDIVEYIKSFVNTDSKMRRWKVVDKEMVIEVLTQKADGMFRWVYCQLVYLRRCIPARIRHCIKELPETLDETYERTLQDIDEQNWEYAHHLFEFVAVASRPLRVEQLADFLAFDFNAGPTPTFVADWRPLDPAQEVLSTCSSLLSIVGVGYSQVIEFSHFSVKEYLMSVRLSKSREILSRYHVSMTPAHTIVVQACLGVLLHPDKIDSLDSVSSLPLVEYAARHWVDHAQVEGVSVKTHDGMKRLFEPSEPHFAAWIRVYDPASNYSWRAFSHGQSTIPLQPHESPLHYAAFFGFYNIVKFLVVERSQNVNARDSDNATPLHQASKLRWVEVAQLLLEHGADPTAQDDMKRTPLHLASRHGNVEVAQLLLEHGADVTAQDENERTPLHLASDRGRVEAAQLLLEHGADVTAQAENERTPLHLVSGSGSVEVAQLLLEHGADVTAQDKNKRTPLHLASDWGRVEVAQLLLEHGADVTAQDEIKYTPLHLASESGRVEVAQLLLEHGADVTAQDQIKRTPLHLALDRGRVEAAQLLLEHGADVTAKDQRMHTPLHLASICGSVEDVQLLLEHGADVTAQDHIKRTPLHLASIWGSVDIAQLLLEHGADVTAQDEYKHTPLHWASYRGNVVVAQLLIEHGADATAQDENERTPLHLASIWGSVDIAQLLLEHGADVTAQDKYKHTPLHWASELGTVEVAQLLLEHGADVTAQDENERTPLHLASYRGRVEVAQLLLEHGADVTAKDQHMHTPLHGASEWGRVEVAQLLLEHGADVTAQDEHKHTPLHLASIWGSVDIAQLLLEHGADVTAQDEHKHTPLHLAFETGSVEVAQLLLEHGADPSAQSNMNQTPVQEGEACEYESIS